MLKFGTVKAVDEAKGRVRVEFDDLDGMISYWLAVGFRKTLLDKDYWMPDIDEHVACLMDEHFEEGVVLCAIYSDADAVPVASKDKYHRLFSDGTFMEYDRAAHKLTASVQGEIDASTTGDAKLTTGGKATVNAQGVATLKSATSVVIQGPTIALNGEITCSAADGASPTTCTLKGSLNATQDIHADGEVSDGVRAISADRTIYNGHTHSDPQGGNTGVPNQQE